MKIMIKKKEIKKRNSDASTTGWFAAETCDKN